MIEKETIDYVIEFLVGREGVGRFVWHDSGWFDHPRMPELPLREFEGMPILFWAGDQPDFVASAYFLLSRYEELLNPVRDEHGRFPGTASIPYKSNFLDRPIVDEYARYLRSSLMPHAESQSRRAQSVRVCGGVTSLNSELQTSNTKPQTSNIQHPTSNFKHQTPNFKHQTSNSPSPLCASAPLRDDSLNSELGTMNSGSETLNIKPSTLNSPIPSPLCVSAPLRDVSSDSKHPTSNIQLQTLNIQLQTLNIQLQTLNIQLQTLNFKLQTLNFKPQTSNFSSPGIAKLYLTHDVDLPFETRYLKGRIRDVLSNLKRHHRLTLRPILDYLTGKSNPDCFDWLLSFDDQIVKCANVRMFECSNEEMFECSNVQECSNERMSECSNVQECSNERMSECSNVQECSNEQRSEHSNSKHQTSNSKHQTSNSELQTSNSKLQTPNSKLQTSNSKPQTSDIEVIYFILARKNGTSRDNWYLEDPRWPNLLARFHAHHVTLGLHTSYAAGGDMSTCHQDVQTFRQSVECSNERMSILHPCTPPSLHSSTSPLCASAPLRETTSNSEPSASNPQTQTTQAILTARHHFLRMTDPADFRYLEAQGITDDFSVGYADVAGFRVGTCRPYRWIDPRTGRLGHLVIHPMTIMECSLDAYMGLDEQSATAYAIKLVSRVAEHGGECVLLWHNPSLCPTPGNWQRELYVKIVNHAQSLLASNGCL